MSGKQHSAGIKQTQMEMEGASTNPELENECENFIEEKQKREAATDKMSLIAERIIGILKKEKRVKLKYMGYEFEVRSGAEKLRCSELKA